MKKILYVDGCINRETSRTEYLAQAYLQQQRSCTVETEILETANLQILNAERLTRREAFVQAHDYTDSMFQFAHRFAQAQELIIAVPCWDLSFPASLKLYIEQICVNGLTFRYTEQGRPEGLTQIQKAVYITTAGGYLGGSGFGFDYIKGLLQGLFCIENVVCFSAEGLDIQGNDPETILQTAIDNFGKF